MKDSTMALTKADKVVVKKLLCVILMSCAVACLTSCSSESDEDSYLNIRLEQPKESKDTTVTLTFTPYQQQAMTRTASPISEFCTRLDVWITNEDGETQDIHQSSSDENFGSVTAKLNTTLTYSIVAIAHKCSSAASLEDGIISFPDDKVTHSMVYTATFSPAESTTLSCEMQRIVAQFRFEIADVVPEEATTMQFAIADSYTRWNIEGSGENAINRTATFANFSRANDGTAVFNIFIIPSNLTSSDAVDITVRALASDNSIVEQRTFSDVPIRSNYKTSYHGTFFVSDNITQSFTVNDWNEFDQVNY